VVGGAAAIERSARLAGVRLAGGVGLHRRGFLPYSSDWLII
jgi:hypothetical protein